VQLVVINRSATGYAKVPNCSTANRPFSSADLSISQIAETLFILTIPFFLQRFGIKKVMPISIFAWVFRFGLFAVGDPGAALWMLVVSMIIYGMAFDFFNISGSLFVDKSAVGRDAENRRNAIHRLDPLAGRLRVPLGLPPLGLPRQNDILAWELCDASRHRLPPAS
jgi:hypothetical protein